MFLSERGACITALLSAELNMPDVSSGHLTDLAVLSPSALVQPSSSGQA